MPFFKRNETPLYYEVYGQGSSVIFLGGLGATCEFWILQKEYFSGCFQTVFLDNRASGRSVSNDNHLSVSDMVSDTVLLMEYLKIDKAHFVTSSMGGFIGLELGAKFPDKALSITFINSSYKIDEFTKYRLKLWEDIKKTDTPEIVQIKEQLLWILPKAVFSNKPLLHSFIDNMLNFPFKQSDKNFSLQLNASINFNGEKFINRLKMPTMVLSAYDDLTINFEDAKSFADRLPRSSFHAFNNCGHIINLFSAEKANSLINKFIKETEPI